VDTGVVVGDTLFVPTAAFDATHVYAVIGSFQTARSVSGSFNTAHDAVGDFETTYDVDGDTTG
jgi:hypothetical protein